MIRRKARLALGLAVLALSVCGCLPAPRTYEAHATDSLYVLAMAMAAVVAAIVWGLMAFVIVRYRRGRRDTDELPAQTAGSNVLEAIWFAGPLVAIAILFGAMLVTLNTVESAAAPNEATVRLNVNAYRWGWSMEYPDEGVALTGVLASGPEAVLPVGQRIEIHLTASDVIHSFFVPDFLFKKDAIPGHPNDFGLTIEEPGSYAGQCAEYCGLYHAQMPFTIRAVTAAEYEAWLAQQRVATEASR